MTQKPSEASGDRPGKTHEHTLPEFARCSTLDPLAHEAAACLSSPTAQQHHFFPTRNVGGAPAADSVITNSFPLLGKTTSNTEWPPKLELLESTGTLPFFATKGGGTQMLSSLLARPVTDSASDPASVSVSPDSRIHIGASTNLGAGIRLADHVDLAPVSDSADYSQPGRQTHHGRRQENDRERQVSFLRQPTANIKEAVAASERPNRHHPYHTVHRNHDGHYRVGRFGFTGQHLQKFLDSLGHPPSPEMIDKFVRDGALSSDFADKLKSPEYLTQLRELGDKLTKGEKVEPSYLKTVLPPQAQEAIASSLIDQYKAQLGLADGSGPNSVVPVPKGADKGQFNVVNTAVDKSLTPLQRGLLDALAGPESGGHYDMLYGGYSLTSYAWHPGKGPTGHTDAGRYQFVRSTWNSVAKQIGLHDFSPVNQDKAAWYLASHDYRLRTGRDLNSDLERGRFDPKGLKDTWVSIKAHGTQAWMNNQFYPAMKRSLSMQQDLAPPADKSNQV